MSSKTSTRKIVIASMLAVLTCVATMIIKIPSPMKGYLNLGDCVVLLAGWMLSPVYGFVAAGLGSGLADLFSGYVFYAPATFVNERFLDLVKEIYNPLSLDGDNVVACRCGGSVILGNGSRNTP